MADLGYSQLMAEMIAQARPRQAPGQVRPGFIGGGGGMGIRGKQTYTNIGIDIGGAIRAFEAIRKLFGYKSDEELMAYAGAVSKRLAETEDPLERQRIMDDPTTAMFLEALRERMIPLTPFGFVETGERTPLGHSVFTYIPKSPGAAGVEIYGPPTPAGLSAGLYEKREPGMTPSKKLVESQREARVPLPGEVEAKRREKVPLPEETAEAIRLNVAIKQAEDSPSVVALRKAQEQAERELADLRKAEATRALKEPGLKAEELQLKRQEQEYLKKYYEAMGRRADAEATRMAVGLSPEDKAGLLTVEKAFDSYWTTMSSKWSHLPHDEASNYVKLSEFAPEVFAHITGVTTYAGDPKLALRSVSRWVKMADAEFDRPTIKPGMISDKAAKEQLARRIYYIQTATEMIKATNATELVPTLVKWCRKVGMTDDQIEEYKRAMFLEPTPPATTAPSPPSSPPPAPTPAPPTTAPPPSTAPLVKEEPLPPPKLYSKPETIRKVVQGLRAQGLSELEIETIIERSFSPLAVEEYKRTMSKSK